MSNGNGVVAPMLSASFWLEPFCNNRVIDGSFLGNALCKLVDWIAENDCQPCTIRLQGSNLDESVRGGETMTIEARLDAWLGSRSMNEDGSFDVDNLKASLLELAEMLDGKSLDEDALNGKRGGLNGFATALSDPLGHTLIIVTTGKDVDNIGLPTEAKVTMTPKFETSRHYNELTSVIMERDAEMTEEDVPSSFDEFMRRLMQNGLHHDNDDYCEK